MFVLEGTNTTMYLGVIPMTKKIRVPVLSPEGKSLMPTSSARARRWIAAGKAKPVWNDLNIFCVQLLVKPSGTETQEISIGIDPGQLFSGVAAVSKKAVLFTAHLVLPFKRVIEGKKTVKGYIGGYSEPNKVVSIYDVNWKRLGQFSGSKTNLLRRSNGLCIA